MYAIPAEATNQSDGNPLNAENLSGPGKLFSLILFDDEPAGSLASTRISWMAGEAAIYVWWKGKNGDAFGLWTIYTGESISTGQDSPPNEGCTGVRARYRSSDARSALPSSPRHVSVYKYADSWLREF